MPGMSRGGWWIDSDIPPGWTLLAFHICPAPANHRAGCRWLLLSRILSAYQLGHIDGVWEPFFSSPSSLNGTEYIITSDVSKAGGPLQMAALVPRATCLRY